MMELRQGRGNSPLFYLKGDVEMIPFTQIAIVTWIDATTMDGLREKDGLCPLRQSVGFVVKDDAIDIVLCHLYDMVDITSVNRDDESESIKIPRCMVRNVEYLEVEE